MNKITKEQYEFALRKVEYLLLDISPAAILGA
jgi:hypothetical protein